MDTASTIDRGLPQQIAELGRMIYALPTPNAAAAEARAGMQHALTAYSAAGWGYSLGTRQQPAAATPPAARTGRGRPRKTIATGRNRRTSAGASSSSTAQQPLGSRILAAIPSNGITPATLTSRFTDRPNLVASVISRAVKSGKIVERDGKLFVPEAKVADIDRAQRRRGRAAQTGRQRATGTGGSTGAVTEAQPLAAQAG